MIGDILMGNKLYLEPMEEKTYPLLVNWLSDSNIIKFLDSSECNLSLEQIKEIYSIDDQKNKLFTIVEKNLDQSVGICGLQKIDWNKKNAFLRIIIGNTNFWDGKTALESEKLLLKFAFTVLELNKVYSIINVNNVGQSMLVQRLGMQKDGISRNHYIQHGKYVDANLYSILSNEFKDY
jgi:[ribosomal protein S5]-alanine N-acetyltransferase